MLKLNKTYIYPETFPNKTKDLLDLMFKLKDKGEYDKSIACSLEFIQRNDPNSTNYQIAWNWHTMAYILSKTKDEPEGFQYALNKAAEFYKKSIEHNPDDSNINFKLASVYALGNDLKSAIKNLEINISQNPLNTICTYFEENFNNFRNDPNFIEFLFGYENRKQRILKMEEKFKSSSYYIPDCFNEVKSYILGENGVVPKMTTQNWKEGYNYNKFVEFLAPIEHWTDLDLRIIELVKNNFLTIKDADGLYSVFIKWIVLYEKYSLDTEILDKVMNKMLSLGFSMIKIIDGFTYNYHAIPLYDEKHKISCWGNKVMDYIYNPQTDPDIKSMILKRFYEDSLNKLLLVYNPELFDQKGIENILTTFPANQLNSSYEDREEKYTACNVSIFKFIAEHDYSKYKTYLESTYTQITDIHTLLEINEFLYNLNKKLVVSHIMNSLKFINDNKNEKTNFNRNAYLASGIYKNPFCLVNDLIILTSRFENKTKIYDEKVKTWALKWFPKLKFLYEDDFTRMVNFYGQDVVPVFMEYYKEHEFEFKSIWGELNEFDLSAYSQLLQSKLKSKAKYPNEICKAIAKIGDSQIDFALELCNGKTIHQRKSGIYILSLINSETATQHIEGFLEKETNDDIRDMIFETIVNSNPAKNENLTFDEIITRIQKAEKNGRLEKNVKPWLEESSLPKLFWKNGSELKDSEVRYMLYRQNRSSLMLPELELKPLLDYIDLTKSQDFAISIWKLYFENSAQAKDKFVLAICGLLGGDAMIDPIMKQIKTWCDEGRGKMAENLALAMGAIGSNKALRAIDTLSRKYKNKQKNVGEAAVKAFENAAIVMNITPFELADKIIPDFDFPSTFEMLEIKNKNYRAFVDSSFEMIFMDDNGKKIKKLPAGADKETVERFKGISKELKESLKFLTSRLEFYMVVQRRWEIEDWQGLFLKNPVVFPFTLSLVWGIFENNVLKSTFTSLDDCSLVDVNYEPLEFAANQQIGLLHPFEMQSQEGLIESWQNYMSENNITQPFSQLSRLINLLDESKKEMKMVTEFEKIKLSSSKFVRMLENAGWQKGPTEDGGSICSYSKSFTTQNLKAWIIFEGWIYVGYYDEGSSDLAVGKIGFVPLKMENQRYYYYPYNEKDENLIAFGEIPSIVYSEVMADVKMFTEKAKIGE